jgi:hypothetical protein
MGQWAIAALGKKMSPRSKNAILVAFFLWPTLVCVLELLLDRDVIHDMGLIPIALLAFGGGGVLLGLLCRAVAMPKVVRICGELWTFCWMWACQLILLLPIIAWIKGVPLDIHGHPHMEEGRSIDGDPNKRGQEPIPFERPAPRPFPRGIVR